MTQTNARATEIDLAAADWVQRRNLWNWTGVEQIALDAWLAESDTHHIAYLRQCAVWNATGRLAALRVPIRPRPPSAKVGRWLFLRPAAAVALVAVIGTASFAYFRGAADAIYETPVGGHEIITLRDGTRIELNTNTALKLGHGADRRVTLLRGEAYFDVHHDSTHPFTVTASTYRVTDLGTKFSIRASSGEIRVSLLEGSAVVAPLEGAQSAKSAILWPGDVVTASARKFTLNKEPIARIATGLAWRHGQLTFKDTTLAEAVAEFNRYNAKKIQLSDTEIGRLKINGTFQAENSELFAASVQELFGLRNSKNGNETTLSH